MDRIANGKVRRLRQMLPTPSADGKRHSGCWRAVVTTGQTRVNCEVVDLSHGGAKLRLFGDFPPYSTRAWLMMDFLGPIPARVAWERGSYIGLRFMSDAPIVRRLKTLLPAEDQATEPALGGGHRDGDEAANRRDDFSVLERF